MQDLVDQLDSRAARLPVVDPTATDVHSSIEVNIDDRLTRAEIRVAQGLANGLNLEQIAVVNQASIHTVRVQLRSVFAKTGTRQQADLVRVLLSRPALKSA
jgi:DNA-binding CsgD family transcriptional regulator